MSSVNQEQADIDARGERSGLRDRPGPPGDSASLDRRDFLRLMGASLALGGLTACTRQPPEKIVPFVKQAEYLVPGQPRHYATSFVLDGYGLGVVAESHMGRPTKIEGNTLHPASLGGTDVLAQASVLGLYDPDRSKQPLHEGQPATWDDFSSALAGKLAGDDSGKSFRLLTGPVTSPILRQLIEEFIETHPGAVWHSHGPVPRDGHHEACRLAIGAPAEAIYDFTRADVVLSLDSDFLSVGPGRVRYARDFAARRDAETGAMNRLYSVESQYSLTGAAADHRLALRPEQIEQLARALARELGVPLKDQRLTVPEGIDPAWVKVLAADLRRCRGRSLVLAGEQRAPALQSLALALNHALGNLGQTVHLLPPVQAPTASLKDLCLDIADGRVDVLVIMDVNPVYGAPAALGFADLMARVPWVVHHGSHVDETAVKAHWHLPVTHDLEAWGDVRAYDGSAAVIQPLIEPLYAGRSPIELLSLLLDRDYEKPYDLIKESWQERFRLDEAGWQQVLHDGAYPASRALPIKYKWQWQDAGPGEVPVPHDCLDLGILPDPSVWDGRFANNGWLQELPRPISSLTWENALQLGAQTAREWGLNNGDVATVESRHGRIQAPVLISPGLPPGAGVVTLGYGRSHAGRVGNGLGFRATALQGGESPARVAVKLSRASGAHSFALTQIHRTLEGRDHLKVLRLNEAVPTDAEPAATTRNGRQHSFHPPHDYSLGPQWGMVIDLSRCIGCGVCTVACQAENNIPVVGRDEVRKGRELHWMRVDHYVDDDPADPSIHHQPVACMHCENAPCESVCPVNATSHSSDGLNQMVYNQCVGSRYCSNNCPYKARRFNFFDYTDGATASLKLQRNPDVTVRSRGVMEKCTFCIQRISRARIEARKEGRPLADGDVRTACQQACPTQAIVFGDVRDKDSRVTQAKARLRNHAMLEDLGTRPRLTYLTRSRNPNPALEQSRKEVRHGR